MKKLRLPLVLSSMLLILMLLSGCVTKAPVADSRPIIHQTADLTITLRPLSYDVLKERHGSNHPDKINPFIDYPGQIPQRRIVVFEATFETEVSTIIVDLKQVKLTMGGSGGNAASQDYLIRLWENYIRNSAFQNTIPYKSRKFVLPGDFTITPGAPVQGYLVFAEPYPKEGGEGLISMTVSTDSGDTGELEIPLAFTEHGISDDTEDLNTGIFAAEAESAEESDDSGSQDSDS